MRIIYLGDIVARPGRDAVKQAIPFLRETYSYDALIVNADNAAHGFGCTPKICNQFFEAGISAIVTGDHVWNQKEIISFLNDNKRIVRPLNYSSNLAGVGARELAASRVEGHYVAGHDSHGRGCHRSVASCAAE